MTTLNDISLFSITSPKRKQDYYSLLEYYKEFGNSIPVKRKLPSVEETIEYKDLLLEYDEIYEDEIYTDCSPTLFWVFRKGDKLGILTPWHHSEAVYDGYDTDWEHCSFVLYKEGEKSEMNYSRPICSKNN